MTVTQKGVVVDKDYTWKTVQNHEVKVVWARLEKFGDDISEKNVPMGTVVISCTTRPDGHKTYRFSRVNGHMKGNAGAYLELEFLGQTTADGIIRNGASSVSHSTLKNGAYRIWSRPGGISPLRWGTETHGKKDPDVPALTLERPITKREFDESMYHTNTLLIQIRDGIAALLTVWGAAPASSTSESSEATK